LKRRETKGGYEDRLSGLMPGPKRLSAVSRSPLVRAGSRWLSFARGLSRGRGVSAANTPAFIESVYGEKYKANVGGAFSLDKVYRTAGGGLFVSETRLSLSVHPRLDFHLLSIAGGPNVFRASPAQTPPSHAVVSGRGQQRDGRHVTNSVVVAPSLTAQTWNVLPLGAERVRQSFGYVTPRGRRAEQAQGRGSLGEVWTTVTSTQTLPPTVAPASLRLASVEILRPVTHALRQEFVSVLLNTYLPAAVTREVLSVRTARELLRAPSPRQAVAQGEVGRRFAPAPGAPGPSPSARTFAALAPRRAQVGRVEIHREFRALETARERMAAAHTSERDPRPSLLHVLPPASLLLSLSETSLALPAGAGGQTAYHMGGHDPAPTLQILRAHVAPPDTREGSAAVDAPHLFDRTSQHQVTVTRDVPLSLRTFVERVHSTVAGTAQSVSSTFFTRHGFDATLRRGFEQVSARRRAGSGPAAPNHATSNNLYVRPVELVRHASRAEFTRATSMRDAGTQLSPGRAQGFFPTRVAPGAGTFRFATRPVRRATGAADAKALSPTAATAMRLATIREAERAVRESRAARPEGMALELIRHRREQVLQLPRPGYVFTQPARAQLEERQVITKASREEIVEVVRREVRALTSDAKAAPAPSRADFAGLADEVYSTLVRRLMVEKERLGRF
jgi:hypothetical protein